MPAPPERLVEMMFGRSVEPARQGADHSGRRGARHRSGGGHRGRGERRSDHHRGAPRRGPRAGGLEGSGHASSRCACAGRVRPTSGRVLFERSGPGGSLDEIHYVPAGPARGRADPGSQRDRAPRAHRASSIPSPSTGGIRGAGGVDHRQRTRSGGTPETLADVLSGGNQQRLMLAMAPEKARLLLLEQPTRGLDLESARWVWSSARRRSAGATVVFTSSDLDELRCAERPDRRVLRRRGGGGGGILDRHHIRDWATSSVGWRRRELVSRVVRFALPVVAALAVGAVLLALSGVPPIGRSRAGVGGRFRLRRPRSPTRSCPGCHWCLPPPAWWSPSPRVCGTSESRVRSWRGRLQRRGWRGRSRAGMGGGPGSCWPLWRGVWHGLCWQDLLRTRGGVNEIFGGLGLDFVAAGLAVYLILGPWQRQGRRLHQRNRCFPCAGMAPHPPQPAAVPLAIGIALAGLVGVGLLLRGTRPGLRLRAVGGTRRAP